MATLKDLKLKTGVCKRTLKEFRSYEAEEKREAAKTQSMRDNNADPYDIKQQVNVLAESRMMIPDCRRRLEASLEALREVVAEAENDETCKEGEELAAAQTVLAEVEPMFQ
ncbi:hypothetical protein M758_7G153400 [Ceratodon purpureus]|uniref:Tubulin-specific chaperone A n=1 Tax=Ceratodon purpureus TaxID=3225 RepID=A0A8T0H5N5_CERPU|nr:hypothetical protein KC19_7G124900 [Ceratodon purpureus]KAG0611626.1 hypothetical protein M758_7G153400 [Ceratodon purpureus]